jgi:hypothetical protein
MSEQNFAESARRMERGDISELDAFRHGASHRAYGWAPHVGRYGKWPENNWPDNLRAAYLDGYKSGKPPATA